MSTALMLVFMGSRLQHWIFSDYVAGLIEVRLDAAEAQSLVRLRGIPRQRRAGGLGARRRQWKHEAFRGVVRDVPGHVMVLLMDMAVEHRYVLLRHEELDRLRAVARRPVPLRHQLEEWAMSEDDDRLVGRLRLQISRKPRELLIADLRARVRHVIDDDEMHAFMLEAVARATEEFLECFSIVERRVVLARHEIQRLHVEVADDLFELGEALSTLDGVIGGVRQIAGEDDEVGLLAEAVDRLNGLRQRSLR